MIQPDYNILNQRGTPMFFSDVFANRPTAGIVGRIFISTDTKEFYRDTGSTWELIGGPGAGTITGSGTTGTLSKFTSSSSIGDSIVSEIGSAITINGTGKATNWYVGTPTDLTRAFSASGNANNVALWFEEYGNTPNSSDIFMFKGRGTESAKANIQVGDNAGAISTGGYINGNLLTSANWFAEVVNVDTINNHADSDWKLTQTYNSAGTTETFRIRASDGNVIAPNGSFQNILTKTAISTQGWYGLVSTEYITIPANTSFSNLGFSLGSFAGSNLMTFQGNATFGNANATTSVFGTNGFGFSNAGSTITINQRSGGINAFAGVTAYNYTTGTINGTITHLAGLHILAPYQSSSAILQVNNYYGALINASNERTAFTITNRWGIYQEGSLDINYFASKILIGETIDFGYRLYVNGTIGTSNSVTIGDGGTGLSRLYALSGSDLVFNALGDRMVVRQTGNVGINTLSPAYQLDVNGTFRSTGAATFSSSVSAVGLSSTGTNYFYNGVELRLYNSNNTNWGVIKGSSSTSLGDISINGGSGNGIFIASAGNVGIGTTTPSSYDFNDPAKLVVANTGGNSTITIASGTTSLGYLAFADGTSGNDRLRGLIEYYHDTNYMAFRTNAIEGMRITSSQLVGIGITNPGANLVVANFSGTSIPTLGSNGGHFQLQNGTYGLLSGVNTAGNAWMQVQRTDGTATAYNLIMQPSGGNLLIGTSTDSGARLSVNGTSLFSNSSSLSAIFSNGGSVSNYNSIELRGGTAGTAVNWQISKDNTISNALQITPSTTNGGTTYTTPVVSILSTGMVLDGTFRINGQTSGTAGGSSGQHLIINCDGTTYKIALLNN